MRYIFLDTETTGISYLSGERVFEIGCVEMINRKKTGRTFNETLNPDKALSEASKKICKVEDDALINKPRFGDIVDKFLEFLKSDQETIILAHNSDFDIGFLNNELSLVNKPSLNDFKIVDTLKLARIKFPGGQASLNALAKKFDIDLSERKDQGHGALLDADLLADVFLKMCNQDDDNFIIKTDNEILFFGIHKHDKILPERKFETTDNEIVLHKKLLANIKAEIWDVV